MSLCGSCKSSVDDDHQGIKCDFCEEWFHAECAGVSEEKYEQIRLLKKTVFWFCKEDGKAIKSLIKKKNSDDKLKEKFVESIDEIKMEIKKLSGFMDKCESFTGEMKKLSSVVTSTVSFAEAVKRPSPGAQSMVRSSSNGVIVIPKEPNITNVDTEKAIKEKVDLMKISTGVTRLKHLKGAGVFLGTKSAEDSGKLEAEAKARLGDSFKVFLPKPILPELILSNLDRVYSDQELMDEIRETNFGFNAEDKLKIVHRRKEKNSGKWSLIIQTVPRTFHKLVDRYISVDYNDHFIKENIGVLRCYNCQQYNHKAINCTAAAVCARCSRGHKTADCTRNVSFSCINCVDANRNGAKVDTHHSCGSRNCHVHISQIEAKQMKISYSTMPSW